MEQHWVEIGPIGPRRRRADEATYKNVMSMVDDAFLQQSVRARALQGIKLAGIDDEKGEMTFFVRSSVYDKNSTIYGNTVRFKEWADVVDEQDLNPIGRARLLLFDGNLLLNCTCPSFLYHGFRYLLTKQGASLFPEERPPDHKNPQRRGIVCKHMRRTLASFPFYSGDLANHVKKFHTVVPGKERAWDLKSKAADVIRNNPDAKATYEDLT